MLRSKFPCIQFLVHKVNRINESISIPIRIKCKIRLISTVLAPFIMIINTCKQFIKTEFAADFVGIVPAMVNKACKAIDDITMSGKCIQESEFPPLIFFQMKCHARSRNIMDTNPIMIPRNMCGNNNSVGK